jgi:Mrp family chromosome partitioning ATPase
MFEPASGMRILDLAPSPAARDAAARTISDPDLPPAAREQYRQLAAALHNAQALNGAKVVMVASAVGGEGKTLTAANLALTLAESYQRRVLLIDADLRKPSLDRLLGDSVPHDRVESDGSRPWRPDVRQLTPRLAMVTRVEPSADPMAELTSGRVRRLIEEAREAVDWIVVDTPPIAVLPDASLLTSVVDAAVVVVKAGSTPVDLVKRAVDILGPKKILGVVLNAATRPSRQARYGYGYEQSYGRVTAN